METIKGRITHATKTEAEWLKSSVVLLKGEVGFASDTQVIKVGNGKDLWKNLKSHQGGKGDPLTIKSTTNDSQGNTVITFSDNTKVTIKKGETGGRGLRGYKGDNLTISSTTKDSQGNTVITFSDGTKTTINKGDKGDPLTFDDLTPEQVEQIKAKDVDLSNYATKDDLSKVDVSGQLADYAKKIHFHDRYISMIGVGSDGAISYKRDGANWARVAESTQYGNRLALKDHKHTISDVTSLQVALNNKANSNHTHTEYLKKGDPIQLTASQKAELKGADGKSISTWTGTQAQYDALSSKSSTTLYVIKG